MPTKSEVKEHGGRTGRSARAEAVAELLNQRETPAWAVDVLEQLRSPDASTLDLHLLRATVQLVHIIETKTSRGDIRAWVDDDEQSPTCATELRLVPFPHRRIRKHALVVVSNGVGRAGIG